MHFRTSYQARDGHSSTRATPGAPSARVPFAQVPFHQHPFPTLFSLTNALQSYRLDWIYISDIPPLDRLSFTSSLPSPSRTPLPPHPTPIIPPPLARVSPPPTPAPSLPFPEPPHQHGPHPHHPPSPHPNETLR